MSMKNLISLFSFFTFFFLSSIATSKVTELRTEILKVLETMRNEILQLAKARIVDSRITFSADGVAQLSLLQGTDLLEVVFLQ